MSPSPKNRRARYDANGDIILGNAESSEMSCRVEIGARLPDGQGADFVTRDHPRLENQVQDAWIITEKDPLHPLEPARVMISGVAAFTRAAVHDGLDQYRYTVSPERHLSTLQRLGYSIKNGALRSVAFITQPVWVPGRKKQLKEYSRGSLFVFDMVRFGGTFAMIFVFLFTALNYQSFWQIASAQVDGFLQGPTVDGPSMGVSAAMEDDPVTALLTADAKERGDLLAYLPPVGPPDDRMIIPKLGLNVPLEQPSTAALLRQDWPQVETDIQDALKNGVVHYPGTARPGQAGNFFVTGHSSYYPWESGEYKTVFARLGELQVGDEYWVYYGGDKHRYVVRWKKEVSPSDVSVLDQPAEARMGTLMTCTPVGTTLRRLIVRAEEVDPVTGETLKPGERSKENIVRSVPLEALPI